MCLVGDCAERMDIRAAHVAVMAVGGNVVEREEQMNVDPLIMSRKCAGERGLRLNTLRG